MIAAAGPAPTSASPIIWPPVKPTMLVRPSSTAIRQPRAVSRGGRHSSGASSTAATSDRPAASHNGSMAEASAERWTMKVSAHSRHSVPTSAAVGKASRLTRGDALRPT